MIRSLPPDHGGSLSEQQLQLALLFLRSLFSFPPVLLTGSFYWHPDDMCLVSIEQQTCNKSHIWFFLSLSNMQLRRFLLDSSEAVADLSLISSAWNTQK